MNAEPKLATEAILETDEIIDNVQIHPLTCARYALLSKISSPLLTKDQAWDINSLIPTVYIMTSEFKELKPFIGDVEALKAEAYEACEEIDVKTFSKIVDKMVKTFDEMNKLAPNAQKDDKKKSK